ncbi:MAG: glycosyltransferase family 4 protein [Candidatus Nanopelagicales bacterium]
MRILVVNARYRPDAFGGATVIVQQLAHGLRDAGHEVVVFTATYDSRLRPYRLYRYSDGPIPVVAVRVPDTADPATQFDDPDVARAFVEVLGAVRPDVVHAHSLQSLGVGVVEAAQSAGVPTVVTLHDAWWLCERQFMVRQTGQPCGQRAIRPEVCATCVADAAAHDQRQHRSLRVLNDCEVVLAPSAFWRDLMAASGVADDRAAVNANGIGRPRPGWTRSARRGPLRVGYVGGTSDVKGYPVLLAALQGMDRDDYVLVVADAATNVGHVGTTAADWPIDAEVRIVPGFTDDTREQFFDSIDILVFPSQAEESYGMTVREAIVHGVWPIVTDVAALGDHVRDGRNATVVPRAGGAAALGAALADALEHPRQVPPDDAGIPTIADQVGDLVEHLRRATSR